MITDDERRRLAENLRGGYDVTRSANGLFWLNGTLFGMEICARSEEKIRDGLLRLAAFIEPEPERTCRVVPMDAAGNPPYHTGSLMLNEMSDGCSECGCPFDTMNYGVPNYCPHCGAKVVEG